MSDIEWTDETWNPVVGCTPVSAGCLNCYAATMARRLEAMGKPEYAPRVPSVEEMADRHHRGEYWEYIDRSVRIAEVRGGRAVFTGEVRCLPDRLTIPMHWKKPRRIFVNSMSDLFHEAVPFEFIDRVFAVMALCPQHTFQVLTKRPERMAEYFSDSTRGLALMDACPEDELWNSLEEAIASSGGQCFPNVWLGTSVEDQAAADSRIPHLLRCPAAVRFLSCEPLLGEVRLDECAPYVLGGDEGNPGIVNAFAGESYHPRTIRVRPPLRGTEHGIHWVIVGGESGPKARLTEVAWHLSILDQCKAAGVPVFEKQLGSRPVHEVTERSTDGSPRKWKEFKLKDRKGADPSEWPKALRVRQMPGVRA